MNSKAFESCQDAYLDLLAKVLTRHVTGEKYRLLDTGLGRGRVTRVAMRGLQAVLGRAELEVVRRVPMDPAQRSVGLDWPSEAETMIGLHRLENIKECVRAVVRDAVPGDLIETGVWRGGATIFMRAALKAFGDKDRTVWVADSFKGVPAPNDDLYPADKGDALHAMSHYLGVSVDAVRANFAKYGLLDDRVVFLEGWFRDTLPTAPIRRLALLRCDGDLYESTMDSLAHLYPRLSSGGYAIIDDFGVMPSCRAAVETYRADHEIHEELVEVDRSGCVYWRKA